MTLKTVDKFYNVTDEELENRYENEGSEAKIYRFGSDVFKIYKATRSLKVRLNEYEVNYLRNLNTKRILMPTSPIYEERNFIGYSMPFIQGYSKENIRRMKVYRLLEELKKIEEDLILLKDKHVYIDDLSDDNFLYDSKINLIDPGSFEIDLKAKKEKIEKENKQRYNEFIIKFVLSRANISKKQRENLYNKFNIGEYISDIIKDTIQANESVNKYVKRITM